MKFFLKINLEIIHLQVLGQERCRTPLTRSPHANLTDPQLGLISVKATLTPSPSFGERCLSLRLVLTPVEGIVNAVQNRDCVEFL